MEDIKLSTAQYRVLARNAEADLNWRLAVIYWTRALYEYPNITGKLAERDRDQICTAINADKQMLLSICPVCGGDMHGTICPDDITRSWCPNCHKAYNPMGYTDELSYALKWCAREYGRDKSEITKIIEVPQ